MLIVFWLGLGVVIFFVFIFLFIFLMYVFDGAIKHIVRVVLEEIEDEKKRKISQKSQNDEEK